MSQTRWEDAVRTALTELRGEDLREVLEVLVWLAEYRPRRGRG